MRGLGCDCVLLTDEEGNQARLDIFFNCCPDSLASQAVPIRLFDLQRFERNPKQKSRLGSAKQTIVVWYVLTFAPSEWVCVLPYMISLFPYLSLEASMSVCSCSARTASARSRAAMAAVKADSDAEPWCQSAI